MTDLTRLRELTDQATKTALVALGPLLGAASTGEPVSSMPNFEALQELLATYEPRDLDVVLVVVVSIAEQGREARKLRIRRQRHEQERVQLAVQHERENWTSLPRVIACCSESTKAIKDPGEPEEFYCHECGEAITEEQAEAVTHCKHLEPLWVLNPAGTERERACPQCGIRFCLALEPLAMCGNYATDDGRYCDNHSDFRPTKGLEA